MIQKTFMFRGKRYFVRGETEDEVFMKAVEKRVRLEMEILNEEIPAISVNEWFKVYMSNYKQDICEYTYKSYEGLYRNSIAPIIGCLPITAVKPFLCQQVLNSLIGYSESYIKKTFQLMRSMFVKAYENDLIETPPIKGLQPPKGPKKERRALTDEERKAFIKATADGRNSALFCKIIYYCGLRPSEVTRIRGGDYSARFLHVRGTKTKASTRDVPIPSALTLPQICDGELLFHTSSGLPIDKKRIREYWLAIKRDMHLPEGNDLTMYCLRHDYCTRLQEVGIDIDIARRLMGHSSIEVTSKIYTHANQSALLKAAALIDSCDLWKNVTKTPDFAEFSTDAPENEKNPKTFKFQGLSGAPRAIRTRNLLIRRGPEGIDIPNKTEN